MLAAAGGGAGGAMAETGPEGTAPGGAPRRAPPPNTAGRFAVNAAASVLATLVSMTVLVWVNQYLLHRISPGEYALVPVVTALVLVAELFRTVFTGGLTRFMVEADARGDGEGVTRVTSSMLVVLVPAALLVALAGALLVWRLDDLVPLDPAHAGDARIMLALLLANLCLALATTPLAAGLWVRMMFVQLNLVRLGTEALRVAVLFALLFGAGPRALWVVVATATGSLADLLVRLAWTRRVLPEARFRAGLVARATIARLLSFSAWTMVQAATTLVQRAFPVLLLNQHGTAVDVAAFHVGNLPDTQLRRLVNAAAGPAQPALTSLYATGGAAALTPLYFRGGRYHLWVTLAAAAPLLAFAGPLARLYAGETYAAAAEVLLCVTGVYPLVWASAMFYQTAYAVGRIGAFNICSLVLTAATVLLLLLLVPGLGLGAAGAGLALALAFGLTHLLMIWPLGLRLVRGSWGAFLRRTLVPGSAPFAAGLAAGLAVRALVPPADWGSLALGAGAALLAYGVALPACLDAEDRALARRALARLRRRAGGGPGNGPDRPQE